jgi:NAD(P)-dependent dehydrogenase (short-subunit alcohol dehydrogenase family)
MVQAGRRGVVVNTASQAGRRGEAASPIYAATKATVISLSQSAALALIDKGIRVNAIAPGVVDTPMWAKVDATFVRQHGLRPGEKTEQVRSAIPYGRLADPREIAATLSTSSARRSTSMAGMSSADGHMSCNTHSPLKDRVAVVTGGVGGIGLEAANALKANGATIVISDKRGVKLGCT